MAPQGDGYISLIPRATTRGELRDFWHDHIDRHILLSGHHFPACPTTPGPGKAVLQRSRRYSLHRFHSGFTHTGVRTTRHVAHDPADAYLLVIPSSGTAWAAQGGAGRLIRPGEACLIPTWAPLEYRTGDMKGWILKVPGAMISSRLGLASPAPVRINVATGPGGLAVDLLHRLLGRRDGITTAADFEAACDAVTGLLCATAIGDMTPDSEQVPAIVEMVRRHVRLRVSDPTVSLRTVAAALGYAPRTLQDVMRRETGATYREMLWEERLRAAQGQLANPLLRGRSIGAVARSCGYRSGDALGNAFRQRFGMSPGEFRRQALAGDLLPLCAAGTGLVPARAPATGGGATRVQATGHRRFPPPRRRPGSWGGGVCAELQPAVPDRRLLLVQRQQAQVLHAPAAGVQHASRAGVALDESHSDPAEEFHVAHHAGANHRRGWGGVGSIWHVGLLAARPSPGPWHRSRGSLLANVAACIDTYRYVAPRCASTGDA